MSEHDSEHDVDVEAALRSQLSALADDRPATLSPAALVITKVRRSRRRRAVGGALAVALAVTGGTVLGLGSGSGAPKPPVPAQPGALCRAQLPSGWAKALADPANVLPSGTTLVAAAPDGSRVFVQDGNRIVELTDHLRTRRTVMTLPALPSGFTTSTWSASGSFDGTWLVLALMPSDAHFSFTLGLYAWNASTGATRTLLAATGHPSQEIGTWTAGAGRVAWQSMPFRADGGVEDNAATTPHLVNLATGQDQAVAGVDAFVGHTMLVIGKDQVPHGVSVDTGAPVPVPEQLTAFLATHDDWGWTAGTGTAWAWGAGVASKGTGSKEVDRGPASWDVWWSGSLSAVRVSAPAGFYVDEVLPLSSDFAVGMFHREGEPMASDVGSENVLVDLRNSSYAPLTAAQEKAVESSHRALDTADMPRLPHC
jgi:hypothetical protein